MSTKVIDENNFQSENNEMPESSSNLEVQSGTVNDLGALLLPTKSNAEITATMRKQIHKSILYFTIMYPHQAFFQALIHMAVIKS